MRTFGPENPIADPAQDAAPPVMLQLHPFHEIRDAPVRAIVDRPGTEPQAGVIRPAQ